MNKKETSGLSSVQQIDIKEYDYPLPDERIAKFPLPERDKSKLLLYRNGNISESIFKNITEYLPEKSLVVFNNTRVIQARLNFTKETGAGIEIFCLEPVKPAGYDVNFQTTVECRWLCLVGNSKRWKGGLLKKTVTTGDKSTILSAERLQASGQTSVINFKWDNPSFTFAGILETAGILPLPPYLHRDTEKSDLQTYQTVYARTKGSVAAPTAGLHFTPEIINELDKKGFKREELTLHVGAGTFKPVQTNTIGEHEMHTEYISVNRSTIESIKANTGNIVAVGTTSVRTLESLYFIGAKLAVDSAASAGILTVEQWLPYKNHLPDISPGEALQNILNHLDNNHLDKLITSTQIMIAPGYRFRIVNGLITNFHQPGSTLLLLVSAFTRGDWKKIYDYALKNHFRFLSYGDSSFIQQG
jgi:S-adenosylmethionine:tRNA ribosyltransferase-isomerase